jgi:lysophospholipase L1-like esterase
MNKGRNRHSEQSEESRSLGCHWLGHCNFGRHCWLAQQCFSRALQAALLIVCGLAPTCTFAQNNVADRASKTSPLAAKKPQPTGPERFESEIAEFEKWDRQNAVPRDGILFVGSSSIRFWQTAEAFPGLPVINRGFGGSRVPDVNYFADPIVFKYKPRTVVFYAGDNDLAGGANREQVFDDIETFRKRLRERLPNTGLIILPIKPSPSRVKFWPDAQKINSRLKAIAEKVDNVTYVDTATPLLDADGQPRKELFRNDQLHLNEKGYAIWNKILGPVLREAERRSASP